MTVGDWIPPPGCESPCVCSRGKASPPPLIEVHARYKNTHLIELHPSPHSQTKQNTKYVHTKKVNNVPNKSATPPPQPGKSPPVVSVQVYLNKGGGVYFPLPPSEFSQTTMVGARAALGPGTISAPVPQATAAEVCAPDGGPRPMGTGMSLPGDPPAAAHRRGPRRPRRPGGGALKLDPRLPPPREGGSTAGITQWPGFGFPTKPPETGGLRGAV